MNNWVSRLFTMLFVFQFVLVSPVAALAGGEISGGGGNGAVAEFFRVSKDALERLSRRGPIEIDKVDIDIKALASKLDRAKIESKKEDLYLDGKLVHAINYPSIEKIVFNEIAWNGLDQLGKTQLALHELIGLALPSIKDDRYQYSRPLSDLVKMSTTEDVGLAMARANSSREGIKIQTGRTVRSTYQTMPKDDPTMEGYVYTIYVQTNENGSQDAVRIYRIWEDETGAVVRAKMIGAEGPVGP